MAFSAVRNHSRENDHLISDKDFRIVARFRNSREALIGEKLLIDKLEP